MSDRDRDRDRPDRISSKSSGYYMETRLQVDATVK